MNGHHVFRTALLAMLTSVVMAAVPGTEMNPGPAWSVYLPMGPNDSAGVGDSGKKCHWFEKLDANGAVVGGAWYTYLVVKNGILIKDNADPAIWNGASAEIYLNPKANNPAELEILRGTAPPTPLGNGDGYGVMRMVLVRPSVDGMPASPALLGSIPEELGRRADETRWSAAIPGAFWMAADECPQRLWRQVVGDALPTTSALGGLANDLRAYLTNDGITDTIPFIGDDLPVMYTTWDDAWAFCDALTILTSVVARVPDEAAWEYACRAGRSTAYNTERGYTLSGPQWEIGTPTLPSQRLKSADYDAYFRKDRAKVNGSTANPPAAPITLSQGMAFINGAWVQVISTVRYLSEGKVTASQQFSAVAEVEANFDSRYRRSYVPVYAFAWLTHSDGTSAYFSVNEFHTTGLPTMKSGFDDQNRHSGPIGPYATTRKRLAEIVRGLFVPVDANGAYTTDEARFGGFRRVIDGIMPPGMPIPAGVLAYYHAPEYDAGGIYIAAPLPNETDFFQQSDEHIRAAIAGLPLESWWENGTPKPRTSVKADMATLLGAGIEDSKTKATFAQVRWDQSVYDETLTIDLSRIKDRLGRYALRNRWGLANVHGNLAEWCVPRTSTDRAERWNGTSDALDASGYGRAPAYVVLRGGSYRASAETCRSAARSPAVPADRRPQVGFRFLIEQP